ncbi:unnamed protein product, partial [Mesorhabditis belari]|uniref:PH domain-containing protein n=1 Tax=Mesorhabditis belari TaxID=2138241 RepID=A0AAF3EWU4_9BILA
MHAVIERVLQQRQLQTASQLFAISDYDVISDLHAVFARIKEILNEREYAKKKDDQSVVELLLARILTAIRETNSIETYCAELVDVLDCCLRHPMSLRSGEKSYTEMRAGTRDSAHCKIALEILSSLFMHYSKKSVMTLAIPLAIKALSCNNSDLSRNVISYISLSAVHCERVLAQYAIQIVAHIVGGNYALLKVLPQIYSDNREALHAHLPQLMRLLEQSDLTLEEKRSLLQFASRVAANNAELLIPYLPRLSPFLSKMATCLPVLHIYQPLCSQGKARLLSDLIPVLHDATADISLHCHVPAIVNVISMIGRSSSSLMHPALDSLVSIARRVDVVYAPTVLTEIETLGTLSPNSLKVFAQRVHSVGLRAPHLKTACERIVNLASTAPEEVTVIAIRGGPSNESLPRKAQSRYDNLNRESARTLITVGESPAPSQTAEELDKNTEELASLYHRPSSSSLNKSRSHTSILAGQSQRSNSELGFNSRDLSASSIAGPSKAPSTTSTPQQAQTLPATLTEKVYIGKDGRVRPIIGRRSNFAPFETTFPASSAVPITTIPYMITSAIEEEPVSEEPAEPWKDPKSIDRGDVVRQFVDHRRRHIRRFIDEIAARMPIPIQCTVEGGKGSKHRMKIHFSCQVRSTYCSFHADNKYAIKTRNETSWLHLMFLQMEASSLSQTGEVLSQSSSPYRTLSNCWDHLPQSVTKGRPFVTLVTSAFPHTKDQEKLLKELEENAVWGFFEIDPVTSKWACLSCAHPDRVRPFLEEKVLCGELKEKKGRWRFLKRWHTKFFTLSTAALTYSNGNDEERKKNHSGAPSIDLRSIRAVRSLSRGNKKRKSLRKAFEIWTQENKTYVLKANDERKAEEWLQCLQVAIANIHRGDDVQTATL